MPAAADANEQVLRIPLRMQRACLPATSFGSTRHTAPVAASASSMPNEPRVPASSSTDGSGPPETYTAPWSLDVSSCSVPPLDVTICTKCGSYTCTLSASQLQCCHVRIVNCIRS